MPETPTPARAAEITEEMIERWARALLALRGYRYAYDPEEYGQDAYTVTLGAREEARACLTAALPTPTPAASDWQPTHRHVKRGTTYRVLGEARAQVSTRWMPSKVGNFPLQDGELLTIYQDENGLLWARFLDEFNDGRFEALPTTPAPEAGR